MRLAATVGMWTCGRFELDSHEIGQRCCEVLCRQQQLKKRANRRLALSVVLDGQRDQLREPLHLSTAEPERSSSR